MRPTIRSLLTAGLLLTTVVTGSCSGRPPGELLVFAAASLTDVLQAQAARFTADQGVPLSSIRFHFHASNTCALQIRQGAPADLFITADDAVLIGMMQTGMLARGGYRQLVSNRLVLITPARHPSPIHAMGDLAEAGWRRLAIGNPESVPAGRYARGALESLGLWEAVSGRLLLAEQVRQALLYVETGEADAGIVFLTDASSVKEVEIVEVIPPQHTPPILYSGGVLRSARDPDTARAFLRFLVSDDAAEIWRRFGFPAVTDRAGGAGIPTDD